MLHLTAYARTKNQKLSVIAGVQRCARCRLSRKVFDYTCLGDIEELCQVIREALGPKICANDDAALRLAYG